MVNVSGYNVPVQCSNQAKFTPSVVSPITTLNVWHFTLPQTRNLYVLCISYQHFYNMYHVTFTLYVYDSDVVALQLDQCAEQEIQSKTVLQHLQE